ncbi:hypothetical protein UlMin_017502 [Ulmus minor]
MARGGSNGERGASNSSSQNGESSTIEDSSSPYFLHNRDHLGVNLVTTLLNGANYHTWCRAMVMALIAKNKIGFIDGTIHKPTSTDLLFNAWSRCNSMISAWIINAVTREIADIILYLDSAYEIWGDLGTLDVNSYFTKLNILWDELKEFQPVPVCHCGGLRIWTDHQHREYVLQFLMGLNESYAQIRGQILMMEPLPAINKVFSLVIQEERH